MSKVLRVHEHGGPELLRIEELDVGRPGPGAVRVPIEAIGLNRLEAAFRAGFYPVKPARVSLTLRAHLEPDGESLAHLRRTIPAAGCV